MHLLLLAIALCLAFVAFNALVNFFVKLIREARRWAQFLIICSIVCFLICLFVAPVETAEVLRVFIEILGILLKGILGFLKGLAGSDPSTASFAFDPLLDFC